MKAKRVYKACACVLTVAALIALILLVSLDALRTPFSTESPATFVHAPSRGEGCAS